MDRIKLLTPRLSNQIAAGEVVERPKAVLKELLENSIDAGAENIYIEVSYGGSKLVKVRDDGKGIHPDDLPLALTRHATSKISTLTDLEHLYTLGFRGEALASIAAVSRLSLTSKRNQDEHAHKVVIAGRNMQPEVTIAAHPIGTTVEVQDLFFNTRARKQFLHSDKTEQEHLELVFRSIALSNFAVAFKFKVVGKAKNSVINLPKATNDVLKQQRIATLCGHNFLKDSLYFDFSASGMKLWGWLYKSNCSRAAADQQYFFVNKRAVRDKLLNHAVRQSYYPHLPTGRYPGYVLFLEIDTNLVDVNVHPTKHEVRFQQSRYVHDFLVKALAQAQQTEPEVAVTGDKSYFTPTANKNNISAVEAAIENTKNSTAASNFYNSCSSYNAGDNRNYIAKVESYKELHKQLPISKDESVAIRFEKNSLHSASYKIIGMAYDKFLLLETISAVMMFNAAKFLAQDILQQLKADMEVGGLLQKPLLWPQSVVVTDKDLEWLGEDNKLMVAFGLDYSLAGLTEIIVRSIPQIFSNINLAILVPKLINLLQTGAQDKALQLMAYEAALSNLATMPAAKHKQIIDKFYYQVEQKQQRFADFALEIAINSIE